MNSVKKKESVEVLTALDAEHVVNSCLPSSKEDILTTVKATRATAAFDAATGGGALAMKMLDTWTIEEAGQHLEDRTYDEL